MRKVGKEMIPDKRSNSELMLDNTGKFSIKCLLFVIVMFILINCGDESKDVINTDQTPPSIPLSLSMVSASTTSVSLTWASSTDDTGVAGYRLYRDGTAIAETENTSFTDTGLQASTTYLYTVSAYDVAANSSNQSRGISAKTQAIVPGGAPVCEAGVGNCYYIAADGSDAGDGSYAAPYKTALPALAQVQPGDYIYFRGGNYGLANTMVTAAQRIYPDALTTACQMDELQEGNYCYYDIKTFLGIRDFTGWASNASGFSVANGTADNPITVKSYPGEQAILDLNGVTTSRSTVQDHIDHNAIIIGKSHWIIKDLEMIGGIINMGGNIDNITIDNVQVHDVTVHGGDNPGLIRINRGYGMGGPHNILVKNSTLYNLYDRDEPSSLWKPADAQHFGAITALSREVYERDGSSGTGKIIILNNTFYNVPTHFFFKNPMRGPILIENNTLYNAVYLADLNPSNVTFKGNLTVDTPNLFRVRTSDYGADFITPIHGQYETIENNTFVNYKDFFALYKETNYTIRNNVFFGLANTPDTTNWSAGRYFSRTDWNWYDTSTETIPFLDATLDTQLYNISSDNNCFISEVAEFIGLRWRSEQPVDFSRSEVQTIFGYDVNSTFMVESDPGMVFNDPPNRDYTLKDGSPCTGKGY